MIQESDDRRADLQRAAMNAGDRSGPNEFESILFPPGHAPAKQGTREQSELFRDLDLDRIIDGITKRRAEYDLAPLFCYPLRDRDAILYRQEVFREVERETVVRALASFASSMRAMRQYLAMANRGSYRYEKERWMLGAMRVYCEGVSRLAAELGNLDLRSRGLCAFRGRLAAYCAGTEFTSLDAASGDLLSRLGAIRYSLAIGGSSVTVRRYEGEADYTAAVEAIFQKFTRGGVKSYQTTFPDTGRLDHVEAKILERVAMLHPNVFTALDAMCESRPAFPDPLIERFDREIQFYLACMDYIGGLQRAGLPFCYPEVSAAPGELSLRGTFDLALAARTVTEGASVVTNDVELHGIERIVVITGPNQGGKTTLARATGQALHLAMLGCPVAGVDARVPLLDRLLVHFGREENLATQRGRLQDDLVRLHDILARATSRSVLILNEIFASVAPDDAVRLGRRVMAELSRRDIVTVWVTFLDELASFDEKTVSLVGGVSPEDPSVRTFRFERRPPDGIAYALAIAEKYRLTRKWIARRLAR